MKATLAFIFLTEHADLTQTNGLEQLDGCPHGGTLPFFLEQQQDSL